MRIALFSDIHGNRHALDAVLADAAEHGADTHVAIGDLVAIGPEPVAVLERLAELENLTAVRGNTDRYVVTGEGPRPSLEQAYGEPGLVELYARVTASFTWTRGFVTAAGWFDWLERLPVEARFALPDGSRLLAVHAAPGADEGEGIHPARSNAELSVLLEGCDADIVCAGHTHEPVLREIDGVRVANLGCVANPVAPDLRASYLLVDATPTGTSLHHRRVPYDHEAFVATLRQSHHPDTDFIESFQRGEKPARDPHTDHVAPQPTTPPRR